MKGWSNLFLFHMQVILLRKNILDKIHCFSYNILYNCDVRIVEFWYNGSA